MFVRKIININKKLFEIATIYIICSIPILISINYFENKKKLFVLEK